MSIKRKALTLSEKIAIIREVENNPKVPRSEIARRFEMPASTLASMMIKKREILAAGCIFGESLKKRKKMKLSPHKELENLLVHWFREMSSQNMPMNGRVIREKALEIAEDLKVTNFKATNGWLDRFSKRHGISYKRSCIENKAINGIFVGTHNLEALKDNYKLSEIFITFHTGLLYSLLPDKILSVKNETCSFGEMSQERVTVLTCVNADVSERLKPWVIGKYEIPGCMKNVCTLPCPYLSDVDSFVTAEIFFDCLRSFDDNLVTANRNIVLFADKRLLGTRQAPSLRNIKLIFMSLTNENNAENLELAFALKWNYRKLLVRKIVAFLEIGIVPKFNILQAMYMILAAWNDVHSTVIKNCFKRIGILPLPIAHVDSSLDVNNDDWQKVSEGRDMKFLDFVNCDEKVATTRMCSESMHPEGVSVKTENEDNEELVPGFGEAVAAFEVVKKYMCASHLNDTTMTELIRLEKELLLHRRDLQEQTSLFGNVSGDFGL